MKKFFKNNLKTILAVGATAVICISGTAFAAGYWAKDINYTREGSNVKNVAEALNELYNIKNNFNYTPLETVSSQGDRLADRNVNMTLQKGKYIISVTGQFSTSPTTITNNGSNSNESINLNGTNNCTYNIISNYTNTATATNTKSSNTSTHLCTVELTILYQVEVTDDNTILTANIISPSTSNDGVSSIMMQGFKITNS